MEVLKNGQKAEKKPTNAQLQRRIQNAIVHIDKDKETQSIYFSDKGLRLTITMDYAIVETGAHRHVFDFLTPSGDVSRPYIYTKNFIKLANENDCTVDDGFGNKYNSYARLMSVLKQKEDKKDFNLCWFIDKWMFNIFAPLYEIDETTAGSFLVYERYMHNIARNEFLLDEHEEDVTNKQFVDAILDLEKSFVAEMDEEVILKAKSDNERIEEEMEALQKNAEERVLEEQANGAQQE